KLIFRVDVDAGRNHSPQIFPEGDIHRRAIVDGADAHAQDRFGAICCFLRKTSCQIWMNRAFWQHSASLRRDSVEILGSPPIDEQKRAKYRCNQNGTAFMRLHGLFEQVRVGRAALPPSVHVLSQGVAQSLAAAGCAAKLPRELRKHVLVFKTTACTRNLIAHYISVREALEQRDDVGKGFVKGGHIWIALLVEARMYAIKESMCNFVRDNVVG